MKKRLSYIFVFLFVFQQAISFSIYRFQLVPSLYWTFFYILVLYFGLRHLSFSNYRKELTFLILLIISSLLGFYYSANTPGSILMRIIFPLIGFFGYKYIKEHKNLSAKPFNVFLLISYVFSYVTYISILRSTGYDHSIDGDIYGVSSSNAIAISINMILFFYYIVNKIYKSKCERYILLFSVFNFVLIYYQESRMGLIVAFIMIVLSLWDNLQVNRERKSRTNKTYYLILTSVIMALSIFVFFKENATYLSDIGLTKQDILESGRRDADYAFFNEMTIESFIFGYPDKYEFGGLFRLFNAFLNFWAKYGILGFVCLIHLVIQRIIHRKEYSLPLISFLPLFVYSFAEIVWGGTLWDSMIFIFLFYNDKQAMTNKQFKRL